MLHYYLRKDGYTLWEGVYFSTPASAFSLGLLCWIFEREVTAEHSMTRVMDNGICFLGITVLAVTTAISGLGIVKELGGVANKVLVMFRNALVIYPATKLYDEVVTPIQLFGYGLTMLGTIAFGTLKVTDELVVRMQSTNDDVSAASASDGKDAGAGGNGGGGGGGGVKIGGGGDGDESTYLRR